MEWALAAALSVATHVTEAAFSASKSIANPALKRSSEYVLLADPPQHGGFYPMTNVQPNAEADGFSDWELLFRLEMMARSMRGLFDHRPIAPGDDRFSGASAARVRPMTEVMERLVLLERVGDPSSLKTSDARHALRRALLTSELGRGLLLPPNLQDKLERDLCLALAEATDPIADGAAASAAIKVLMDPCTLRHLAALVESNQGSGVSPASTVQVFLQTLAVGQSQEEPNSPSFFATSNIAATD